tara:strand:+ start:259 stop:1128 length:870 start_codon:yes stop_codon:yes gene_type:complete
MKWIGQHIWSFISRFRSDIYIENNIDTSDYAKIEVGENGETTITTNDGGGSAAHLNFSVNGNTTLDTLGMIKLDAASFGLTEFQESGTSFAQFGVISSTSTFTMYEAGGASTDDLFKIGVSANGATEISTVDTAGAAAHLTFTVDGDIILNSGTGVVKAGWHGSTTRIKILHSDFIADDGGRPIMIDDTGEASEEFFLETFSTFPTYATVAIPTGYKATHVMIYGSGTGAVEVWEHQINSKTGVSKGTGNVDTEINITDVTSSTTNYLFIKVAAGSDEIHGGYVTIATV